MNQELGNKGGERDPWSDRLSEYLDGGLGSVERRGLEAHLAGCPACSAALADLREVVDRARALEDTAPALDLWPAIEAQLEPRLARRRGTVVDGRAWWARRFDFALPQLAAAAILLVTLPAGAVWLAVRGPAGPAPRVPAPAPTVAGGVAAVPDAPGAATPGPGRAPAGTPLAATAASTPWANPRYDAAVADLERTLEEGRGRLDPRTLEVVEKNLRIIDDAIEDARRAVAADPGNTWLRSHLAATMKRKVDLLRSATMLAIAQG